MRYATGFILEAYIAGVIQRSKYIRRLNAPASLKTLATIAKGSSAHHRKLAKYLENNSEYNELDLLDAVYGIDFLVQVADDVIAIDVTRNHYKTRDKLHHLKQSAIALESFGITKWAVMLVHDNYTFTEMDILDIHLDGDKFNLIHLIDCNH